jgi:hypothetical protein
MDTGLTIKQQNMKALSLTFFSWLALTSSTAQNLTIKSYSEMPPLHFSVAALHTENPASLDRRILEMAAVESSHLDSIEKNYALANPRLQFRIALTKAACYFLTGNWEGLRARDTNITNNTLQPSSFKSAVSMEFNVIAQVARHSPVDFIGAYKDSIHAFLQPFTVKERKEDLLETVQFLGYTGEFFKEDLDSLKNKESAADTALFYLFQDYAGIIFHSKVGDLFSDYYNDLLRNSLTRGDTLRGTLLPERSWWDVQRYDITVRPDYLAKTISGKNKILYKVVSDRHPAVMQIDLQEPMHIDSIFFNDGQRLSFTKDGNAWHVAVPAQNMGDVHSLLIYFEGKVHEAVNPPWEGGWSWLKDSLNNPLMTVTCQGIGASIWYPCKDHQSDEPDQGAALTMIVPDTLMAVSNGRMLSKTDNHDGTASYTWAVVNPINNYEIIPYIGKYVNFGEVYKGLKGDLDLNYWVLNYHLARARDYMPVEVKKMLQAFEDWFGPYPFYEDGYKLVESPAGSMEHQSAVAYSGTFKYGFIGGQDVSRTGWGKKWDYMIVHESGHEWFGNNITSNDIADMWVHEGITCYSETVYTEYWFGKEAGNEYNVGSRWRILNGFPIIGYYGVNDLSNLRSSDMYIKGAALLQTIRHSMDDDERFKGILKGLNKTFYHQTVNTGQIENYISRETGYDYSKVFEQYLRTIQIPKLEFYFSSDMKKIFYRYTNCIGGFDLPLVLKNDSAEVKIFPGPQWKDLAASPQQAALFTAEAIKKRYYLEVNEVKK